MGLDLLEYAIALEHSFGVSIPDADVADLKTARHVATYMETRLAPLGPDRCLTQQAFYTIRDAASRALAVPPDEIQPAARWQSLLEHRSRETWRVLQHAVGAATWPAFRWLRKAPSTETVGQTAHHLAVRSAAVARRNGAPWSRGEITFVVRELAREELNESDIPWDAEFVRDLGCG